jgi:hypothetical protein
MAAFLLGLGAKPHEVGPERLVPDWATPENFADDAEWPLAEEIEETLKNRFRLLNGSQLNASERTTRYLIPGILVAGQPGGIYGAAKTLKTSLAADLLISLASGTPFLGRFPVPQSGRVLFLSGESGLDALQSLARRICAERGLSLESLDNFVVSTDLPRLDRPVDLLALQELVERERPVCVVIDPAYLALGSKQPRNLFAMGELLRPLTELCESSGAAVLLVHHGKRGHNSGRPAALDDIAGTGFAEFSAQWLTLARRRPFEPETGQHELWLSVGGRSGQQGLWALDVDEGALLPASDAGPILPTREETRMWKTALRSVSWAEAQVEERFVATREDRQLRRRALAVERQGQRVLELLTAHPDGCSARFLRDVLGVSGDRMARLLEALVKKGGVNKEEERLDRRRTVVTYSRLPAPTDLSQAACEARRAAGPDRKVYDVGTGQFVERQNRRNSGSTGVECLNAAMVRETAAMLAAKAASAAADTEASSGPGRDSDIQRENSRNLVSNEVKQLDVFGVS